MSPDKKLTVRLSTLVLAFLGGLSLTLSAAGTEAGFDARFDGGTLRLDYVFCGDATRQEVYFLQAYRTSEWAGRRHHLTEPLLKGNGQIRLLDPQTGETLYANSFSSLFQEWQSTPEAAQLQRAFENCFQVPFPREKVEVELSLYDTHGRTCATLRHSVDPSDILIRQRQDNAFPRRELQRGGGIAEAIDVVIVSDGYGADDYVKFFADAGRAREALMRHEPFRSHAGRFNIRAVFAPSAQSGVSVPHDGDWRNTAFDSHFDTFYSTRYLTTSAMRRIYDALGTVPFEHVIVLVNTPVYGGGGIYNSLTIMGSDHPTFDVVIVHEFGHAFGGLADEYFYLTEESDQYPLDVEPWEPNITTLVDFSRKWKDMLPAGVPVPTPLDSLERQDVRRIWKDLKPEQKAVLNRGVGVYEGAGYRSKGVYRPVQECRMRINECEEFCPVCSRAIERMIDYYCY